MDDFLKSIFKWITNNWYNPYCGLAVFIIPLGVAISIFRETVTIAHLLIAVAVGLIFVLFWYNSRKLPTCPRNRIGFIIAITTENEEQYMELKSDFIDCVRDLTRKDYFHVLSFPEYHARKVVESGEFGRYLEKARGTFILSGRCRRRNIRGMDTIVLDLDGGVHHRPIPVQISKRISREFRFLLPKRIRMLNADEFVAFEFTSHYITIVAKYIVGLASFLTYDLRTSINLLLSLRDDLKSIHTDLHTVVKIKEKIPILLADALREIAADYYEIYRSKREKSALETLKSYLDKAREICPDHYRCHLLRAIYYFEAGRDVSKAMDEIEECRDHADASWLYSLAFLNAYVGNMKVAIENYRKAFRRACDISVPLQVEEFMREVLDQEPNKLQLFFCCGFMNFKVKEDYRAAKNDFETFLRICPDNAFMDERRLATTYLNEINTEIRKHEPREGN